MVLGGSRRPEAAALGGLQGVRPLPHSAAPRVLVARVPAGGSRLSQPGPLPASSTHSWGNGGARRRCWPRGSLWA